MLTRDLLPNWTHHLKMMHELAENPLERRGARGLCKGAAKRGPVRVWRKKVIGGKRKLEC